MTDLEAATGGAASRQMSPVLEVKGLTLAYEGRDGGQATVVTDVNFSLAQGEILGLVGESGSGKSTTALAAMGYRSPNVRVLGGSVRFGGLDLLTMTTDELRQIWGRRIGFVAQQAGLALNPSLRIGRQLAAPLVHHMNLRGEALRERMVALLRMVDLPDPEAMLDRHSFQFSGGQQQRIAIALALACGPEVLVMDEPTTGLDATTQARISATLQRLVAEQRIGVVYVSHDLGLLHANAHRIAVMQAGRIVETGSADQIVRRGSHPYTRALMAAAPRIRAAACPPAVASGASPVLSAEGIVCTHPGAQTPSVHGISLEVARSEMLGIIGESGSGKSTLLRVLAGLLAPTAGRIRLEGSALAPLVPARQPEARAAIQLVFQNPDSSLNPRQTIGTILSRPIRLFRADLPRSREAAEIASLLESVRLPAELAGRFPAELSGGQKQRVAIARAFAAQPRVLLCDEITSALDVSVQAAILELLRDLSRERGVATIFVSHDLAVIRTMAQRTMVMRHGRVVESGPTARVFEAPQADYTRSLLQAVHDLPPIEEAPA